jgi:hypothetical protein
MNKEFFADILTVRFPMDMCHGDGAEGDGRAVEEARGWAVREARGWAVRELVSELRRREHGAVEEAQGWAVRGR